MTAAYPPILAESLTESLVRPGAERHARVFAGDLAQVPEAREFTARALAGCPAGARDALLLCVTELAANAVEHTASGEGGAFAVEVSRPADGVAYVAVTDAGTAWEAGRVPLASGSLDDALDCADVEDMPEGGRGLALVAAFSNRWGCCDVLGGGRIVWAEATWPVLVPLGGIPQQALWKGIRATSKPGDGAA